MAGHILIEQSLVKDKDLQVHIIIGCPVIYYHGPASEKSLSAKIKLVVTSFITLATSFPIFPRLRSVLN